MSTLQMSVTMMAATLMRHFRFEAIHPKTREIPCAYDITVGIWLKQNNPPPCCHRVYSSIDCYCVAPVDDLMYLLRCR
jgi:hypothetical protein